MQLGHCCLHQVVASGVELAVSPEMRQLHLRIVADVILCKSIALAYSSFFDPKPDLSRWFSNPFIAEFFVFEARDFDMDIDAVKQRA